MNERESENCETDMDSETEIVYATNMDEFKTELSKELSEYINEYCMYSVFPLIF